MYRTRIRKLLLSLGLPAAVMAVWWKDNEPVLNKTKFSGKGDIFYPTLASGYLDDEFLLRVSDPDSFQQRVRDFAADE